MKIRPRSVFGAKSRQGRLQDAAPNYAGQRKFGSLVENDNSASHFGAWRGSKIRKKSNFWVKSAQGPSKMTSGREGGKNMNI